MSPEKLIDAALAFKLDAARRVLALLPLEARARLKKGCAKSAACIADAASGLETSLRAFSASLENERPTGPVKVDIE